MCQLAARFPVASLGLYASHDPSALLYDTPPRRMTLVARVARTVLTSDCMPTAVYEKPEQVPLALPSRQQPHEAAVLSWLFGQGSLKRSKSTALLPLKALATPVQNDGE